MEAVPREADPAVSGAEVVAEVDQEDEVAEGRRDRTAVVRSKVGGRAKRGEVGEGTRTNECS